MATGEPSTAVPLPQEGAPKKPSGSWLPSWLVGYDRRWLAADVIAGITLAAVSIPECMGYTKIAGTPVITGLYTILLPISVFALLGSSRHLVVGADSATAAMLFAALSAVALPYSAHWLALTEVAALITAAMLLLATVLRLGFLADFLSRTVLVGFLSGVGVSLIFGQLPDMLGVTAKGHGFFGQLWGVVRATPHARLPTFGVAVGVVVVIAAAERWSHKAPGALIAVGLAIVATFAFRLDHHGVAVVGQVAAGLPSFGLPRVSLHEAATLVPLCASMFLVIVAQSAATSRSFAQKRNEPLNENRDLLALGLANAAAGLSGTFVVNGSPTKTAVVDSAGGRTQVSQLTTAAATLAVLLFATRLIAWLPVAALAAMVFLIGVKLVDVESLRRIYRFRKATFLVALGTMAAVVLLGVERGIFLAVALSILDHMQQEYRPKDVVLVQRDGHWKAVRAEPGAHTEPGLILYRFQAPLFFANVDHFVAQVWALIRQAPHPVEWLVLDLVSMSDIDYTAGLALETVVRQVREEGITVALAEIDDVSPQLEQFGVARHIGPERTFESTQAAVHAFHERIDPGADAAPPAARA